MKLMKDEPENEAFIKKLVMYVLNDKDKWNKRELMVACIFFSLILV